MKYFWLFLMIFILTSCSLAPKYQRPCMYTPAKYKEIGKWLIAKPASAVLDRGPWWENYHDPLLSSLEARVISCNQNLKAAIARYEAARAELKVARSAYFPTVEGIGNATRQATSKTVANPTTLSVFNDVIFGVNLNYEVDVWGRVRNSVAAAKNTELASAADLAFVNLSLQAELANDYFALRGADAEIRVLDETIVAYQRALYLTRKRYHGGAVSVMDVDEAQTQLETAKTAAADMRLQRAQLEHAIAILIGQTPAAFTLPPTRHRSKFIALTPELPSTLLERRPDVAEAEYLVQAANANIGVARAAYFPAFNLASAIGFESVAFGSLFKKPSMAWSLGPTVGLALLNNGSAPELSQIIFDGGRISGITEAAWAQYKQTVAKYRQTVLTAYQEVEDSLAAIRQLDREYHTQSKATAAANRTLAQAMFRYKGGLTTYLDVVVVQTIALQTELADINIHTRRQIASVQLIKALGGGWHTHPPKAT